MNFIHSQKKFPNFLKAWMKLQEFYKFSFLKVVITQEDQPSNFVFHKNVLTPYSYPRLNLPPPPPPLFFGAFHEHMQTMLKRLARK